MMLKGLHSGRFFEVQPTGREIRWAGAAFFTTDGKQIVELWVLGDVDSVKQQLDARSGADFSFRLGSFAERLTASRTRPQLN
jgi:hypothetical protein